MVQDLIPVTLAQKPTYFRWDGQAWYLADGVTPNPNHYVPAWFKLWGYLMGINPDGSEGGLGGKPIQADWVEKTWAGNTGLAPLHPDGWIDLAMDFQKAGDKVVTITFQGDTEWAGCAQNRRKIILQPFKARNILG